MTTPPDIDERLTVVHCPGCETVSLIGDCRHDGHKRLQCYRCGTRIPANAVHDFVLAGVAGDE